MFRYLFMTIRYKDITIKLDSVKEVFDKFFQKSKLTFIPCHLEIARKGRRALNVRRLLKAIRLSCLTNKLQTDTMTMKQSSIVQTEEKYFTNPNDIHFSTISTENRMAKVTFKYPRISCMIF